MIDMAYTTASWKPVNGKALPGPRRQRVRTTLSIVLRLAVQPGSLMPIRAPTATKATTTDKTSRRRKGMGMARPSLLPCCAAIEGCAARGLDTNAQETCETLLAGCHTPHYCRSILVRCGEGTCMRHFCEHERSLAQLPTGSLHCTRSALVYCHSQHGPPSYSPSLNRT